MAVGKVLCTKYGRFTCYIEQLRSVIVYLLIISVAFLYVIQQLLE